jgi:hypothetical protein
LVANYVQFIVGPYIPWQESCGVFCAFFVAASMNILTFITDIEYKTYL